MDTLTKEQSAPVELLYDRPASGQVAPEVLLMWCLRPDAKEELIKRGIEHPHLLIVVTKDGVERGRHFKPLTDGACSVGFDDTGVNEVHAQVVWPVVGESVDDLRSRIMMLSDYRDGYQMRLLEQPSWVEDLDRGDEPGPRPAIWKGPAGDQSVVVLGLPDAGSDERHYYAVEDSDTRIPADEVEFPFGFRKFDSINCLDGESVESFDVDPALFAKPPRELTKRFVGFFPWGRGRAADQCKMRSKILKSCLAAPFVGLYWVLLRAPAGLATALFLMWMGIPGVSFRSIIHPVRSDFRDIWFNKEDRSRWYLKKDGEDTFPLFWALNPAVVGVLLLILSGINIAVHFWPWWAIATVGLAGPIAVLGGAFLVEFIVESVPAIRGFGNWIISPVTTRWTASRKAAVIRKQVERKQEATRERELLKQLACGEKPRETRIRNVNGGLRTAVPLLANRGKNIVCKRYARS